MSNASSESNPPTSKPGGRLNYLVEVQHAGALALIEFLLLGTLQTFGSQLVNFAGHAAYLAVILLIIKAICLVLFLTHSIVTLLKRVWDPWFSLLSIIIIYFYSQIIAGALQISVTELFSQVTISASGHLCRSG